MAKQKEENIEDEEIEDGLEDEDDFDSPTNEQANIDNDLFGDSMDGLDDWGYGGTASPMEKHSDLLKELTNFSPYHKDLINGWLGLTWNETEEKYSREKHIDPIMNEKCAAWCLGFLRTYTRNNNIITNIGKNEYIYMVQDIIEVVWLNIAIRDTEFGIKNMGDVFRICNELQHAAELILMGAGDGKYNKLLSETTQRNESLQLNQQQQQRGIPNAAILPPPNSYVNRGMSWLKGR